MKIICLSDLHLTCNTPIARLDNIEETWKRKLKFVFDYATTNKIPILIAGDFFDKPRDWKTLSEFIKFFDLTKFPQLLITAIFGQHDMYLYSKDRTATSLGVLLGANLITELTNSPTLFSPIDRATFYGCSWGQEIPVPRWKDALNILVIHKNISDAPLFPGHEYSNAETFLRTHPEYKVIVCGDIHRRFSIVYKGRCIINPGPLLRMEATEYNMTYKPAFFVLDTVDQTAEWIDIPHEPASKILTRNHIDNKKETENMLDDFIKNISIDHKITFSFKENLQEYLTTNKIKQEVINFISEVMNEA